MTQLVVLAGVLAATAVLGWWWQARDGKVRDVADRFTDRERVALGAPAGHRLLVEFTAPSCAPCTAARRVLEEVAAGHDDVAIRVVDVGEQLDLARAHGVMRTPTTFVVDADGTVLGRVAGVPETADIVALLEQGTARDRRRAA